MKKITTLLLIIAFVCVGCCGPLGGSAEHRRAHRKAIARDMQQIHKFFDKHFWNYDWDDPFYN